MKKIKKLLFVSVLPLLFLALLFPLSCSKEATSSRPKFVFKTSGKPGVVATINGREISEKELYKGIENDIYQAEMKVYELKFNRLKALFLEEYVKKHPKKGNLSNDEFLNKFISKSVAATEKDVEKFIKERKIPQQHINPTMKDRIKKYLEVELKRKSIDIWLAKQTEKNPPAVFLVRPTPPEFKVSLGDSPTLGAANAKVDFVIFSDFECPYCAKGAEIVNEIKKRYGKKVKFVFKNFPLPFHKNAKGAAMAALCVNEQKGKAFWKFHDELFENQSKLDLDSLKKMAGDYGLDQKKFNECLDSNKYSMAIENDLKQGKDLGIRSTPTFFINGKMISGAQDVEVFSDLIDQEIKKS